MMLPILISVSVAPVSYFFCASAPLQVAMSTTAAAEKTSIRDRIAISDLSLMVDVSRFFLEACVRFRGRLNTFCKGPARKGPPREVGGPLLLANVRRAI